MPEDAVLDTPVPDTPVDDSPVDTVDTPDPDHSEHEPPEPGDGADTRPATNATPQPAIVDGKKLSEQAKATLDEIKAKDPHLAAQIRKALFESDAFRRELPGGLKEVRELRQQVEELGGFDGISQRGQELAYFNELDQKFTSADPGFVAAMTDTPEGQNAFLRLMPSVLAKFSELNSDGHSAYMAQAIVSHMQSANFRLALERLGDFLPPDKPQAKELWDALVGYYNGLVTMAGKPVAPAKAQPAGSDPRASELDQREQNLTSQEWQNERNAIQQKVFEAEWNQLAKGRKITPEQAETIRELYNARMRRVYQAQNHRTAVDRFFANRDKQGYLRHQNSLYRQETPKALRAAFDVILPARPGPKTAPAAGGPRPGASGKPGQPATGYSWLAKAPDKNSINFRLTTPDMIRAGKAVLSDGKKVQWRTT